MRESNNTCRNCRAVLSMPSDKCQNCGQAVQPPFQPDTTNPIKRKSSGGDSTGTHSSFITAGYNDGQAAQAANVERLLEQIAAQSHFEDRYNVGDVLARGGMGEIFRAYDLILQRDVAIKMMRSKHGATDTAIRGQFLKEARVGGRLLHPHVLAVFDLGVNRAGQIYYTMRLVDGASLQQCLDSVDKGVVTKLISYPLRKIVAAFCGACEGVDYAHQNGVIHLDIKPHNILMSGFNEVFVIDWGLARVDEVDDTESLLDIYRGSDDGTGSNTAAFGGHVVGTPGYMAPEQAQGMLSLFNPSTDVFGLGGVLYFILYGVPPNRGSSPLERFSAAARSKEPGKLREGILPKGRRVKKEVGDAVAALESICLRALEPNQADRYADVDEFIVELNEWLDDTTDSPLAH